MAQGLGEGSRSWLCPQCGWCPTGLRHAPELLVMLLATGCLQWNSPVQGWGRHVSGPTTAHSAECIKSGLRGGRCEVRVPGSRTAHTLGVLKPLARTEPVAGAEVMAIRSTPSHPTSAWGPLRVKLSCRQIVGGCSDCPHGTRGMGLPTVKNLLELFQGEKTSLKG